MRTLQYENIKNAHIVPASYLGQFAMDGKIGVRIVREEKDLVLPIEKVGTRYRYYRRERPKDGSSIDDVEWSLSVLEGIAAPVLTKLDDLWPLDREDKRKLAELFALQVLRGPRWMAEHEDFSEGFTTEALRTGTMKLEGFERTLSAEEAEAVVDLHARSISSTGRLTQMLRVLPNITSVFGSMHWTLVEFASPVIATSDHPVVLWPRSERCRYPVSTPLSRGVLETVEVRVPVSPIRVLLMTWADHPDENEPRPGAPGPRRERQRVHDRFGRRAGSTSLGRDRRSPTDSYCRWLLNWCPTTASRTSKAASAVPLYPSMFSRSSDARLAIGRSPSSSSVAGISEPRLCQ